MTIRTRILDMLPALVVFAVVAAFSTFVFVEFVVRDDVPVPPQQTIPAHELPQPAHDTSRRG